MAHANSLAYTWYTSGINTIEDAGDFDDNQNDVNDANDVGTDKAATATAVLEFIAKSLAEDPAAVEIEVSERQGKIILSLSV